MNHSTRQSLDLWKDNEDVRHCLPSQPDLLSNLSLPLDSSAWEERRMELKNWIEQNIYGQAPSENLRLNKEVTGKGILPGLPALHHEWKLWLPDRQAPPLTLNLGLHEDDRVRPLLILIQNRNDLLGIRVNPGLRMALERGWNVATFSVWDVEADDPEANGWRSCFPDCDWGALACWAWAIRRSLDHILELPTVDRQRVMATGHSRRGKTSLLAAALDERITLVAPNACGLGGISSYLAHRSPRCHCENLKSMLEMFPHWYSSKLRDYADRESSMTWEANALPALIAPRPIICTEASDDPYAFGPAVATTLLSLQPLYRALGVDPEQRLRMSIRPGGHAHLEEDFRAQLDFAEEMWTHTPTV